MASGEHRGRKRNTVRHEDEYTTKRSRSDHERTVSNPLRTRRSRRTSSSSSSSSLLLRSNPTYDLRVSTRRPLHDNSPDDTLQTDNTRQPLSSATAISSSHSPDLSSHNSQGRNYLTRTSTSNSPSINDLFEFDDGDGNSSSNSTSSDILITGTTTTMASSSSEPVVLDDLFTVDLSSDTPEPPPSHRPSVGVQGSNVDGSWVLDTSTYESSNDVDVILVESDYETEDVIVTRETILTEDEQLARRLQAQFDHQNIISPETFGTIISTRSMTSNESGESSSDEHNIIHDNMEALATRIDSWSVADAARFLMVTIPSGHRGSSGINRHMFERRIAQTHPMYVYAAIMGGPSAVPPGVSSMGSYEDLLDIAEQLGPARSTGLSEKDIKSIKRKRFKNSGNSSTNPSNQSCVVCMNEFEVNELIKRLDPCKHDFHSSCIDPWLKNHKTCPICRSEVIVPSN